MRKEGDEIVKRIKSGDMTITGQINTGTFADAQNRIQLFDGKFTTGFRIVDFHIWPKDASAGLEVIAKLSTEPISTVDSWNWQDRREMAWAGVNTPIASRFGFYNNVRNDNMTIEDLWISGFTSAGGTILFNYEIVLEKYEFPAWDGAATLAMNNPTKQQ